MLRRRLTQLEDDLMQSDREMASMEKQTNDMGKLLEGADAKAAVKLRIDNRFGDLFENVACGCCSEARGLQ